MKKLILIIAILPLFMTAFAQQGNPLPLREERLNRVFFTMGSSSYRSSFNFGYERRFLNGKLGAQVMAGRGLTSPTYYPFIETFMALTYYRRPFNNLEYQVRWYPEDLKSPGGKVILSPYLGYGNSVETMRDIVSDYDYITGQRFTSIGKWFYLMATLNAGINATFFKRLSVDVNTGLRASIVERVPEVNYFWPGGWGSTPRLFLNSNIGVGFRF